VDLTKEIDTIHNENVRYWRNRNYSREDTAEHHRRQERLEEIRSQLVIQTEQLRNSRAADHHRHCDQPQPILPFTDLETFLRLHMLPPECMDSYGFRPSEADSL
jgi:hypothetical protein